MENDGTQPVALSLVEDKAKGQPVEETCPLDGMFDQAPGSTFVSFALVRVPDAAPAASWPRARRRSNVRANEDKLRRLDFFVYCCHFPVLCVGVRKEEPSCPQYLTAGSSLGLKMRKVLQSGHGEQAFPCAVIDGGRIVPVELHQERRLIGRLRNHQRIFAIRPSLSEREHVIPPPVSSGFAPE